MVRKDEVRGLTKEEDAWLDQFFADLAEDKEFMDLLRVERDRLDRSFQRLCSWGTCEYSIDPVDNKIVSSIGIVGCACDGLPGWRSQYYDGLPKRGWNIKARGRHGGRIAQSRRKHAEHARWLKESGL